MTELYYDLLIGMSIAALIVFIALFFINAGYGMMISKQWGWAIPNRVGWIIMEVPVFVAMTMLWVYSDRVYYPTIVVIFILFQLHYFQRAFIFPLKMMGKSKIPLTIVALGVTFNGINAFMQGGWLFYFSPENMYTIDWLYSPQFIIGTIIFFSGMFINIKADAIIRCLRKPGDTNHYIPYGGMYKYVTSANYFGEIVEWIGFAILTWSLPGLVFAWWSIANLVPRANSIHKKYIAEFGDEYRKLNRKRIFPFIY